ncbi:MAG: 50S ribosomal protein L9, partial [Deltaproteobacteria bacterium]
MAVEVILRDDVPHLGKIGDVVRVKPGYARNFLFPRGLAIEASGKNLRVLEHQKRVIGAKADRERKAADGVAKRLEGLKLSVK